MIVTTETPMQKSTERKRKMTTEKTLSLVRMSDVQLQEVKWLWKPYIPFGKLTIIQGDPGEGKTTFALRLAAACSSGVALPGMEIAEPFNVIYQTAEDGLGDTIKQGLLKPVPMKAGCLIFARTPILFLCRMKELNKPSNKPMPS